LLQIRSWKGTHACGGTILNSKYILTAAHCIYDDKTYRDISPWQIKVFVGEQNTCKQLSGLVRNNDYCIYLLSSI
jgi:secreted trypsin-like serine protease